MGQVQVMLSGDPESLTDAELQLDVYPIRRLETPRSGRAWVRYPAGPLHLAVDVVAWTDVAAAVRWVGPRKVEHHAWVWGSAIQMP
jgi:hypothetical protein